MMELIEKTKIYTKYVLHANCGMKHEILFYKDRGFVSYWLSIGGIGNDTKFFTKHRIIEESLKIGYASDEEKILIQNTLLYIAMEFVEGGTPNAL